MNQNATPYSTNRVNLKEKENAISFESQMSSTSIENKGKTMVNFTDVKKENKTSERKNVNLRSRSYDREYSLKSHDNNFKGRELCQLAHLNKFEKIINLDYVLLKSHY